MTMFHEVDVSPEDGLVDEAGFCYLLRVPSLCFLAGKTYIPVAFSLYILPSMDPIKLRGKE